MDYLVDAAKTKCVFGFASGNYIQKLHVMLDVLNVLGLKHIYDKSELTREKIVDCYNNIKKNMTRVKFAYAMRDESRKKALVEGSDSLMLEINMINKIFKDVSIAKIVATGKRKQVKKVRTMIYSFQMKEETKVDDKVRLTIRAMNDFVIKRNTTRFIPLDARGVIQKVASKRSCRNKTDAFASHIFETPSRFITT